MKFPARNRRRTTVYLRLGSRLIGKNAIVPNWSSHVHPKSLEVAPILNNRDPTVGSSGSLVGHMTVI